MKTINNKKVHVNKYGLAIEKYEEAVAKKLKYKKINLVNVSDKNIIKNDNLSNFLIEGENLYSLKFLQKTHKESIDIVYIVPPYNTHNKSFRYDDDRVDYNDKFLHSKWLSFMKIRLKLTYKLMKKNSLIFISIDDNELYNLKLLCDEIFGLKNFVCNVVNQSANSVYWLKGSIPTDKILRTKDYVLIYKKGKINFSPLYDKTLDGPNKLLGDIWNTANYYQDLNTNGGEGGIEFYNGKKPLALLEKILTLSNNKSAVVLDFFAGSGTTGEAVMKQNKIDGGNRKFILCTNNEGNICEEVTYERLKTAITGIKPNGRKYSIGYPENLIYYKVQLKEKYDATQDSIMNKIKMMKN